MNTSTPNTTSCIDIKINLKKYHALVEKEIYELAIDLLGPVGLVSSGEGAVQSGRWLKGFLHSRGATIGAGTAEIQKNTIAEQILGLPRDSVES